VPTQENIEFASKWYVRGGLTYAQETYPEIAPDSTFSSPSVLNTDSVGAGLGYKVNGWFRTDLIRLRSKVQAAGIGPSAQSITAVNASGNVTATDICTSHLERW
jgi:opacity protein-like surface antigen